MSKKTKIILGLIVAVLLIVGGVSAVKNARQKNAALPKAKIYPLVVSQLSPKKSHVKLTLPYLAEVSNEKDVELSSRIAARVLQIKPSGAQVKKAERIVTLDTTEIQSSLASIQEQIGATKIALDNLRQSHKRTLALLKVQGASIEQSQQEESAIAAKKAALEGLKQKEVDIKNSLSYATITSPVDGVIAKTFLNEGALSTPGKPLVAISAENGFYLMVRTPSDTSTLGVKFNTKTYKARALGSTYNGLAEYKVYTDDIRLTSGDRVEVDVVVFDQDGFALPFDAVLNLNEKSYVLQIEQNHAAAKEVHILQSGQEGVVVAEDLQGKNIVVAKPDILLKLTSGYRLKIKE